MTKQYCNTHINKDDIKFSLVKNILHIFYIEINILAIKPKFVSWYNNLILICGSWRLNMVFKSDISSRSPVLPPSHSIFLSLLFATLLSPALLHCSYCKLWVNTCTCTCAIQNSQIYLYINNSREKKKFCFKIEKD